MKKLLILCLSMFMKPLFASGVGANDASAPCNDTTLETYSGTSNLEVDWAPNTINLRWYDRGERLSVQSAAQTCSYDGTITLPPAPAARTGYTFIGWELLNAVPAEYTELQYIESTGTQYIRTGIRSRGIGLKSEVKLSLTTNSTSEMAIIGRIGSGYETYFTGGNVIGTWYTTGKSASMYINYEPGILYTITSEITNNSITTNVNGSQKSYNETLPQLNEDEIVLFEHYGHYHILAKVYYIKFWNNGTLVRNFVPARRNSDNVVGMWDSVTQTFFTNAGSGAFIAGPVVQ